MAESGGDRPRTAGQPGQFHAPDTTITDYLRVISTRRWLVISTFVVIVGLAALYVFTRTPLYRSTARLQIAPGGPNGGPFQSITQNGSLAAVPRRDFLETQVKLIASERLVANTIERFGIHELPRFRETRNLASHFKHNFVVEPVRRTWLVDVSFYWPDAKLGAQILNYQIEQYVKDYGDRRQEVANRGLENLRKDKEKAEPKLEEARRKLVEFEQEHGIISFDEKHDTIAKVLMERTEAEGTARQDLAKCASRLAEVERAVKDHSGGSLPDVLDNPLIRDYRNQKALCEQGLREGLKRFGENHPEIKSYRAKLESINENIQTEIRHIVQGVRKAHSAAKALLASSVKDMAEQKTAVLAFNNLRLKYDPLKREFDARDGTFKRVLERIRQIEQVSASVRETTIRVERHPKEETRPAKPRKVLIMALSGLMGLALGVGLAFLLDCLDTTLKSKEHVTRYLGLNLLGYVPGVPELAGAKRHHTRFAFAAALHPRSAVAEAFRSIRTALSFSVAAQEVRHIMVTSASPSEGKTLVAVNVAAAIAQTGKKVLLVDADMRKPAIHRIMEADQTPGLTNLLVGEGASSIEEVVRPTSMPNLFYIPSGPIPPNPAELIGCERMKALLEQLTETYDRVIIDPPPVVNVTDAAVLCNEAHGVVFVVRGFRTQREVARRAIEVLAHSNAQLLGCVLNNVDVPRGAYYYDSYYRYQQYYYYAEDGAKRKRTKKKRRSHDDTGSHKATA